MGASYKITEIMGIPIRVHITLLIFIPFLASNFATAFPGGNWLWGLVAALGLFTSVALHELGHSAVALTHGCRVRDILLIPFGGMAQLENLPRNPMGEILIAAAGPAVSLLLAALGLVGFFLFNFLGLFSPAMLFGILGGINLMLALFNLLPSFPMDGGRIFRAFMTPRVGRLAATRKAARIGRFMAVIFGIYGLFNGLITLVLIAVFIYFAAGSEYRMVAMQEAARSHGGFAGFSYGPSYGPAALSDEIIVGPPPYARRRPRFSHPRSWFEELARDWR